MPLVNKENILTAHHMYMARLELLQLDLAGIVTKGLQMGEEHQKTTMQALDEIERELEGIEDCLTVLRHLFRS